MIFYLQVSHFLWYNWIVVYSNQQNLAEEIQNIVWALVPAKNDYLRTESVTPIIDLIGSIFQVIFIATLCFIVPKEKSKNKTLLIGSWCCIIFYLIIWIFYYMGIGNIISIILSLSIAPCVSFLFYEFLWIRCEELSCNFSNGCIYYLPYYFFSCKFHDKCVIIE